MINWLRVSINDSTHQPLSPPYVWDDRILGLKLFRGPLITIFYLFLLSINISVWIKFNINFVKIFKLKAEHANKYLSRIRALGKPSKKKNFMFSDIVHISLDPYPP